jgi:PAS domain-containing protein
MSTKDSAFVPGNRSTLGLLAGRQTKRDSRAPESRLVLEALLSSMPVPLTVWNSKGILGHANPAAQRLLGTVAAPGTTADEWMRTLEPRTLSGLPLPLEDLAFMRALQGESPSLLDMRVRLGNRSLLLETSAKPILDGHRQPCGALLWCPTAKRASDERSS